LLEQGFGLSHPAVRRDGLRAPKAHQPLEPAIDVDLLLGDP